MKKINKNSDTNFPSFEDFNFVANPFFKFLLGVICFWAGAATMIIEIAGNRVLAPLFGNSLYTWTALIGVVLISISAGGWIGGWLVDQKPKMSVLGYLLLLAATFTALISPAHLFFRDTTVNLGLITGPVLFSLLLFTIPALLLGAVSPFVIRLLSRASHDQHIGISAGLVGMLATLGSFIGTFMAGFWLIPNLGVRKIFILTALSLGVLGVLTIWLFRNQAKTLRRDLAGLTLLASAALGLSIWMKPTPQAGTLLYESTFYHDIHIFDQEVSGRGTVRAIQLDSTLEGAQDLATGGIVLGYQQYWQLARAFCQKIDRALFFGGGAFTMPERLAITYPNAHVDAVEIDPEVIKAGKKFFRLDEFPNLTPHAIDARRFLFETKPRYDLIFGDAYNGVRYIPAHLVTVEFFNLIRTRLTDDGVYLMNLISAATGKRSALFQQVFNSLQQAFPHVEVFATQPVDLGQIQNFILTASSQPLMDRITSKQTSITSEISLLLGTRVEKTQYQPQIQSVLTDDHNPVEYLVVRQLKESF